MTMTSTTTPRATTAPGSLTTLALLALLALGACGPQQIEPASQGGRGESCLARNDCKSGLACVNQRCSKNDFDIKTTAKSCDLIECESAEDCCKLYQSPQCDTWKDGCDSGDDNFCTIYDSNCSCDAYACDDNRCTASDTCTDDFDCFGGATCVGGECVECDTDTDCGDGNVCVAKRCEAGCERNEQCPLFHACTDGKCEETGCTSDRECIAAAGDNPLALEAKCKDTECEIACNNDAECGTYSVCEDGTCSFIGCESDDECRYFLGVSSEETLQAVCRE